MSRGGGGESTFIDLIVNRSGPSRGADRDWSPPSIVEEVDRQGPATIFEDAASAESCTIAVGSAAHGVQPGRTLGATLWARRSDR